MTAWMLLALASVAEAGWVKSYVDEESVVAEDPHEEREISYRTTFDTSSSVVLKATSVVAVSCTRWSTQTIEIVPTQLKQKVKNGEVVAEKRKPMGLARTVQRDTPKETSVCDEQPAEDVRVAVLGKDIVASTEGVWTLSPTDLRDDQLVRIARGDGGYEVSGPSGREAELFPEPVADWASDARRQLAEAQGREYEEAAAAAAAERAAKYKQLPRLLRTYRGPWSIRHEVNPMDDGLDIVVSREARSTVRTTNGSFQPRLVGQCTRGTLDLFIDVKAVTKPQPHRNSVADVELRLDQQQAEQLEAARSADGRALFLPVTPKRLQEVADARTLHAKLDLLYSRYPANVLFDLTDAKTVFDFLLVACPDTW